MGQRKLENLSISHISEKVFEILENKFGLTIVKYLITLITASRDGLLETELVEMLEKSKIIDGEYFCPFLCSKNIKTLQNTGVNFRFLW